MATLTYESRIAHRRFWQIVASHTYFMRGLCLSLTAMNPFSTTSRSSVAYVPRLFQYMTLTDYYYPDRNIWIYEIRLFLLNYSLEQNIQLRYHVMLIYLISAPLLLDSSVHISFSSPFTLINTFLCYSCPS